MKNLEKNFKIILIFTKTVKKHKIWARLKLLHNLPINPNETFLFSFFNLSENILVSTFEDFGQKNYDLQF